MRPVFGFSPSKSACWTNAPNALCNDKKFKGVDKGLNWGVAKPLDSAEMFWLLIVVNWTCAISSSIGIVALFSFTLSFSSSLFFSFSLTPVLLNILVIHLIRLGIQAVYIVG